MSDVNNQNLENFLKPSHYCDCDSENIINKAKEITANCKTNRDRAVKIFYWVRDNIPYTFGRWDKKASVILNEKKGMCTSKAVLLVSLLRAVGIPAGFGVLEVKGREYLGVIALSIFTKVIKKTSIHIYGGAFLNGKWVKIDPSADYLLSAKTSYFNPTTQLVDWDGRADAMENLDKNHILKDSFPLSDINNFLQKKPKTATGFVVKAGNLYLDFLRQNDQKINDITELELLFRKWLKKNHFWSYYSFFLAIKYRRLKLKLQAK
ncbi:MAG: transglutaminase-like domain-containing protein [Patescibacteria group bacterium]|nr:transglutaminase-like domain-containing protein [Patescibacteria group bacterium]MDD4611217.1 transglutaminase-like domain-containing protein [Patescibacteria group bacterium]